MIRSTLFALLALTITGHVASQQPIREFVPPETFYLPGSAPLSDKDLAKDKFQSLHPDLRALARDKVQAARIEFESRNREFLAGRGTLDFLIQSIQRRLEAEIGFAENDADRLLAFERQWEMARVQEIVNKARFEAGRIPIQDMAQSTYFRLDAEIQWAEERERQKKK